MPHPLSAEQALLAAVDGPIPPAVIRAARAKDDARAAAAAVAWNPAHTRSRARILRLRPAGKVEKLAADMRRAAFGAGAATRDGLIAAGWSAADLDRYGPAAAACARKAAVRIVRRERRA